MVEKSIYEVSDRVNNDLMVVDILKTLDEMMSDCNGIDKYVGEIMLKEENAKIGGLSNDELAGIVYYKSNIDKLAKRVIKLLDRLIDDNMIDISNDLYTAMISLGK